MSVDEQKKTRDLDGLWRRYKSVGDSHARDDLILAAMGSCFGKTAAADVVVGMILAAVLDRFVSFGLGIFSYVFGLVFAVACGYALGHLVLRTADLAISPRNAQFAFAVRRSLMARDLLYFKTVTEILVFLRFVRWKGV
jgi:hypothetical protein